jgi:uncharacterized repeat protein (TIGR04138 family)
MGRMQYQPAIQEITRRDGRYPYEAYEFIEQALQYTQRKLGREPQERQTAEDQHHISGPELVMGTIDFAKREFGMLACTVFRQWNVHSTGDIGELVFNLIDAGILFKNDKDSRANFQDLFNIEDALNDEPVFVFTEPMTKRMTR